MSNEIKAALITCAATFICTFIPMFITIENNNSNWIKSLAEISEEVDETMSKDKALKTLSKEIESKDEEIKIKDDTLASKEKEIAKLQKEIEEYSNKEGIDNTISKATDYWNNNNYTQALVLLRESEHLSQDISLLYKQYSSEYCDLIIVQANELIAAKKLDEAKSLIDSNINIVKDKSPLKAKLEEIDNYKPIKLSSIKLTDSRHYNNISNSGVKDTVGNVYSGNGFILNAEGKEGYGYGTFYLGGKYNSMSICISVSDDSEILPDTDLSGWLGIYRKDGEDYTLVERVDNITRVMKPVEFDNLDFSNAEWLEIRYYNNGEYWNLAAGNHSLKIIVSKGMLYK